ncbi:threonine/serine exporter family protein [uncultured Mailhella sp.]|uniref:threonine/serine exporter family protein n=1 Tax=uncultured Mailhella sp. TaxID=1981031 RepID=UPI0025F449B8|nr:threonine/serine exporter family protein [uncultured Mailhella sp.]
MIIPDWLIQLVTAFTGALGFAVLFNVQSARLFWAGLGGLIGWAAYLALGEWYQSDVIRFFLASACFTVYAEPLSRLKKTPTTVFLVPAAIPMVPGASLYRSMSFAVSGHWSAFAQQILYTLLLAAAIAAGMVCAMTLLHITRMLMRGIRQVRPSRIK